MADPIVHTYRFTATDGRAYLYATSESPTHLAETIGDPSPPYLSVQHQLGNDAQEVLLLKREVVTVQKFSHG